MPTTPFLDSRLSIIFWPGAGLRPVTALKSPAGMPTLDQEALVKRGSPGALPLGAGGSIESERGYVLVTGP